MKPGYELPPGWPKRDTVEAEWWSKGAHAEVVATREGMTKEGLQFYECVETLAQRGDSPEQMARWLVMVFTAGKPYRRRLGLAWEILIHPVRMWIVTRKARRRIRQREAAKNG